MPEQSLSNTCIFSLRHVTTFLGLGTLASNSTLCLRAILNSKISKRKHKYVENVALNGPQEGHLVMVQELK